MNTKSMINNQYIVFVDNVDKITTYISVIVVFFLFFPK